MRRRKLFTVAMAGLLAGGALVACSDANTDPAGRAAAPVLTVGQPNGPQTENHNPFLSTSAAFQIGYRWVMYEPLMMWNPVRPAEPSKPWLASDAQWAADNKSVKITMRDNATWSDGTKVTAADVAFTHNLIKANKAINLINTPYADITVAGNVVTINFTSSMFVLRERFLGQTPIVPEHLWKDIKDPGTATIKNPVGSGPYVLKSFTPQTTTLVARTDGYWQELPKVKELRYTSFTDNTALTTALSDGTAQWGFVFIPNPEAVFTGKDPEHYKIWAPAGLGIHGLYINTTRKPFDNVALRQAMNMVVDREAIFQKAEAGYFHPPVTSLTGLPSPAGDAFIAPEFQGKNHAVDVEGAKRVLNAAGFTYRGDTLIDPTGAPVKLTLTDPAGWSDYQTSLALVKDDLAKIGIAASIDKANQDAWRKNVQEGKFDATFRWTNNGSTPYDIYQTVMDGALLMPVGKDSQAGNFGRFDSPEATRALKTYREASDEGARAAAMAAIQKVFVEQVPMIPVGADNYGMSHSTKHWVGWPDDTNPYAAGQPNMA
ncbi:MAG TPA: ABC transporter substrate-binding protein, partial [Actinoplanes sp.]|nr:ABC transporter substrate-binding protein [Actinoplanes sp.]